MTGLETVVETGELDEWREKIDEINFEIIDLLAEGREESEAMWKLRKKRNEIVEQIAVYKVEHNIDDPYCKDREDKMYIKVREYAASVGVDEDRAVNYIRRLVEISKQIQRGIMQNVRRS